MLKQDDLKNVGRLYHFMSDWPFAYVTNPQNSKGSYFSIAIRKIGWIQPVYLIVDNQQPILANYIADAKIAADLENEYCIFSAYHHFTHQCKKVEIHWVFHIEWLYCTTHCLYVTVLENPAQK